MRKAEFPDSGVHAVYGDAEEFGGLFLVPAGAVEGLDDEVASSRY
jgi:hypothetical protein